MPANIANKLNYNILLYLIYVHIIQQVIKQKILKQSSNISYIYNKKQKYSTPLPRRSPARTKHTKRDVSFGKMYTKSNFKFNSVLASYMLYIKCVRIIQLFILPHIKYIILLCLSLSRIQFCSSVILQAWSSSSSSSFIYTNIYYHKCCAITTPRGQYQNAIFILMVIMYTYRRTFIQQTKCKSCAVLYGNYYYYTYYVQAAYMCVAYNFMLINQQYIYSS